jgi:hypothetical protein
LAMSSKPTLRFVLLLFDFFALGFLSSTPSESALSGDPCKIFCRSSLKNILYADSGLVGFPCFFMYVLWYSALCAMAFELGSVGTCCRDDSMWFGPYGFDPINPG